MGRRKDSVAVFWAIVLLVFGVLMASFINKEEVLEPEVFPPNNILLDLDSGF
jgi:hypothetical protein